MLSNLLFGGLCLSMLEGDEDRLAEGLQVVGAAAEADRGGGRLRPRDIACLPRHRGLMHVLDDLGGERNEVRHNRVPVKGFAGKKLGTTSAFYRTTADGYIKCDCTLEDWSLLELRCLLVRGS